MSNSTLVSFSITGEFITEQAKDFMMEPDWCRAIKFLKETLIGITLEQCIMVLKGDTKIIGDSRNDDVGMVEVEERDKAYDEQLDFAYHHVYAPLGSNFIYRPYGYVGSYSTRDMEYSELKGKAIHNSLYYARDDRNDLAIPCTIEVDGITREVDILFEKLEHQLPHWIKPNRSAQLSCDKAHFLTDEAKYWREIEKRDEEEKREAEAEIAKEEARENYIKKYGREERNFKNFSGSMAADLKDRGLNIDRSMIDSLLEKNDKTPYGVSKQKDFQSGYLDRRGKFYGCAYAEHIHLAEWICENILKLELDSEDPCKDPQATLDDGGWVKLQRSALTSKISVFCQKKPTQKQINAIFDHSEIHGPLESLTQKDFFENGGQTEIFIK